MAYFDLVAGDAYGRFSRKLAKLAGLQTACYWSEVLNIITKVVKKHKFDDDGFFKLDRKYISDQLPLSVEEQLVCDTSLQKLGILDTDPDDVNRVRVRLETFTAIIVDEDIKNLKAMTKVAKVNKTEKALSKKQGIIDRLKAHVNEPDTEVYEMYGKMIEVCYDKGLMQNAQIDLFQQSLNAFTQDKEVKLEILKIAIEMRYKVCDWCISRYQQNQRGSASRLSTKMSATKELNNTEIF